MKAIVLFDTIFGNTERIANSLAKGMLEAGIAVECANIKMARLEKLPEGTNLLAMGAPTQYITSSRPMKDFLDRLKGLDLKGKYGFAFDTKLDNFMAGSAAKFIEKKLKVYGVDIIKPHISAIVVARKENDKKKIQETTKIGEGYSKRGWRRYLRQWEGTWRIA